MGVSKWWDKVCIGAGIKAPSQEHLLITRKGNVIKMGTQSYDIDSKLNEMVKTLRSPR